MQKLAKITAIFSACIENRVSLIWLAAFFLPPLGDLQKTLTPRCAVRARSAMAGWSVETQRESKRPKAVMADRVHESSGTFTGRGSERASGRRGAADISSVYRVFNQLADHLWVGSDPD